MSPLNEVCAIITGMVQPAPQIVPTSQDYCNPSSSLLFPANGSIMANGSFKAGGS